MSCVEQMKYKLYLERTSFKDAREYIEKNSEEVYYVDPGYKIFKDYYIIGVPPVAMGVGERRCSSPMSSPVTAPLSWALIPRRRSPGCGKMRRKRSRSP